MSGGIYNINLSLSTSLGLQDVLQGVIARGFSLTDYDDTLTSVPLSVSNGRADEFMGALYRVSGGDFEMGENTLADGVYYISLYDGTEGNLINHFHTDAPSWRADLGGWYYEWAGVGGDEIGKTFFRFEKSSGSYINKTDIVQDRVFLPEFLSETPNFFNSDTTEAAMYTAIKPYIPTVGNTRSVSGGIRNVTTGKNYIVNKIYKDSATSITVYGLNITDNTQSSFKIDDGGADTLYMAMTIL